MTRPRSRIGSELLPVFLILCCLAGSWTLVVSMHRRAAAGRKPAVRKAVGRVARVATPPKAAVPPAPPPPAPEPVAPPPVEDPTRTAVARLGAAEAEEMLETRAADRRADGLERARLSAVAESERWKRKERVVRDQIDALEERARSLDHEADTLAMERDVLAHERDITKAALAKARNRSSFAVLPNRAPNGTWRRPIVIECRNGTATIQPRGQSFSLLELSNLLGGTRSSPIVLAVVRELIRAQGATGPDGSPAVPYIFFVIRPDGIRPYYEARARLESLGIAFGYELVDQDMEIDFPDLDHPDEWDGSAPLSRFPVVALDDHRGPGPARGGERSESVDDFRWPTTPTDPPGGSGAFDEGSGRVGRGGFPAEGNRPGGPGPDPRRGGDPGVDPRGFGPAAGGRPPGGPGRPGGGTPGMLPPSNGQAEPRGMPPTASAAGASGSLEHASGPAGAAGFQPSGGREVSPEHFAPGHVGGGGAGRHDPSAPHPHDVASLDGVSLLGRRPGEAAPFRPRGLKPGEPGAPPEMATDFDPTGRGSGVAQGSSNERGSTSPNGTATAGQSSGNVGRGSSEGASGGMAGEGEPGTGQSVPLRIEVPMEIVVACGPRGVTIHPGGYQLTAKTLNGKENVLARSLKTIVRHRQQVDPLIRPRPSIRFLVESGGGDTYRSARRQTVLSGIDWPTVLQVADTRVLDFFPRERF